MQFPEWKVSLHKLREDYYKNRFPSLAADHGIPAPKQYNDNSANGLTNCIKAWINYSGGDAQRVNTMGIKRKVNGVEKWTRSAGRRGSSDVHAIFRGRAIFIEIKFGKDELSNDQLKEKQRIEGAGGIYYVARSMEGFVKWWDQLITQMQPYAVTTGN